MHTALCLGNLLHFSFASSQGCHIGGGGAKGLPKFSRRGPAPSILFSDLHSSHATCSRHASKWKKPVCLLLVLPDFLLIWVNPLLKKKALQKIAGGSYLNALFGTIQDSFGVVFHQYVCQESLWCLGKAPQEGKIKPNLMWLYQQIFQDSNFVWFPPKCRSKCMHPSALFVMILSGMKCLHFFNFFCCSWQPLNAGTHGTWSRYKYQQLVICFFKPKKAPS